MEASLAQAMGSRGRSVLIAGEPGIGKTTLAEAFGGVARDRGAAVVWGRCWEAGGAPAYWPWVQALRGALSLEGVEAALDRVRPFVDVVSTLIPEIAGPTAQRPREGDGDHERFVLFDAISRVIQTIAAWRPLVVILDDLHAADPSSLFLLRFVARDIRTSRCLVVGAYREHEAQADPVTREMLADVAREGELISVEGLPPDAMAVLLEGAAGAAPSDSLLASLDQITEGNPFYATEIMRLLLREGKVEARLDLKRKALPVPSNVMDTVLKRVRGLDPTIQTILDVAAVIGREFPIDPLATASGVPLIEIRARLATAQAERVIRATGPDTFIFDHGLIREALYGSMSDRKRAELHGKVAKALENVGVDPSGENLAEIAHHYLRAALDDARPPFRYAIRAGRRALDVFAYEQAIGLYEEASALAALAHASPREKSVVLTALGEALIRVGRVTEAKERLTHAAAEARLAGSAELLSQAVITFGFGPAEGGVVDRQLIALTREALEALSDEPSRERALLMARWAHELMLSGERADVDLRERLSAESLQMIKECGDQHDLGRVLRSRFSTLLAPHRLDEAMAIAQEVLSIGLELRDTEMQLIGRVRRAAVIMMRGDVGKLDVEFSEIQRLAAQTKQPLQLSPVAFFKACLTGMRSDIGSALKDSDAAMAVGSDVPNAMGAHLLQHVGLRLHTDGAVDFEPFMRAAIEQRPGIRRTWSAALGATLARAGRKDEAKVLLREAVDDLPNVPVDSIYMAFLYCAIEIARFLREPNGLEPLYDALLPYRDQHIVQVMVAPVSYFGSSEWHLGTLASLLERWDVAEEHLNAALREHTRMGARTHLAWTQAELGELLIRRARPGDTERASELLREAERTASELGLTLLLKFLADVSDSGGAPSEPSRASMVREGEYVTIIHGTEVVRLKDSKGIAYLAQLLANPDRELHVLEVASPAASSSPSAGGDLNLAGDDAGPVLDARAKEDYRRRIRELQEEIEEAESFNDPTRAERAREELGFIAEQLSAAVGLGGRDRKAASNVERARVNVTKRIKTTIDKIASSAPNLGRHLQATVKTGTYLSYSAHLEQTLDWELNLEGS